MKKKFLFIASTAIFSVCYSQKIKVSEENESIGGGRNNALVVNIYDASPDDIEREWRSLMKDYGGKTSSKDGGIFADNAVIKSMGNNTIDVYAKAGKPDDKGGVRFVVAFDLGGAFLNSSDHKDQYKTAKEMVYNFATRVTKEAIAGQLKAAQKLLEKKNDEMQDLQKDKEKLEKNMEDYKEKIKKAEDEIVKNKEAQEKKKQEIEAQKKVVEAVAAKEKAVD